MARRTFLRILLHMCCWYSHHQEGSGRLQKRHHQEVSRSVGNMSLKWNSCDCNGLLLLGCPKLALCSLVVMNSVQFISSCSATCAVTIYSGAVLSETFSHFMQSFPLLTHILLNFSCIWWTVDEHYRNDMILAGPNLS